MSEPAAAPTGHYKPLISPSLIRKTTIVALGFAALTFVLSMTGRWVGERIASGGHSLETDVRSFFIEDQALQFPANVVRFENQRQGGTLPWIDLYLLFPQMTGYSDTDQRHFNDPVASDKLIFLTIRAADMPLDMSGRLEPIYRRLTHSLGTPVSSGLTQYAFLDGTRYVDEVLFVGEPKAGHPFVARCLEQAALPAGARGCMRDVAFGEALSVEYRFSQNLLPQWKTLDAAVLDYVTSALSDPK